MTDKATGKETHQDVPFAGQIVTEEDPKADQPQGPGDGPQQDDTEEFWAGRNHAMRRSARVAA